MTMSRVAFFPVLPCGFLVIWATLNKDSEKGADLVVPHVGSPHKDCIRSTNSVKHLICRALIPFISLAWLQVNSVQKSHNWTGTTTVLSAIQARHSIFLFCLFGLLWFFEIGCYYVALADLKLTELCLFSLNGSWLLFNTPSDEELASLTSCKNGANQRHRDISGF